MSFVLSDEEEALRKTARELAERRLPVSLHRALRDARDPSGFSREAFAELAALGLVGAAIPDAYGGAGLGQKELGLVVEELGRTLAATPLLASSVLSANAILLAGGDAERRALLPGIASGATIAAFAHEEGAHHAPFRVAARARAEGDDFVLDGEKSFVVDAHVADVLLVVARVAGEPEARTGLSFFVVPSATPGVAVTRLSLVDARNAGRVRLAGVRVPASARVGGRDVDPEIVERVLDRGRNALSAELLGLALAAFDRTLAYLKERRQFGVRIGSFQALQHRAATMFCELELAKSVVREALVADDADRPERSALASAAKARTSDVARLVTSEALQMHGGIGVTDDLDVGFFYKRAKVAEAMLGDAAFHRDRFAALSGY